LEPFIACGDEHVTLTARSMICDVVIDGIARSMIYDIVILCNSSTARISYLDRGTHLLIP